MTRTSSASTSTAGHRVLARLLAALVGGLLLLSPAASRAFAHAQLVRISPADGAVLETAPRQVELEFSEPVGLIDGAIRLFSSGAEPIGLTAVARDEVVTILLPDGLSDGVYAVSYRVVSADGHPVASAISFQVGAGQPPSMPAAEVPATSAATETLVVLLTAAQYLGLLLFTGLVLFHRLVLRPARAGPPRLVRGSLTTAVAASVLLIPGDAVRLTGGQPWEILWPPSWTDGVGWPPVAAAVIIGAVGITALWAQRHPGVPGRAAVPLAAAALTGPLLVGHTQTTPPVWLMLAADLGHLIAASFWLGGLLGLLHHLRQARNRPESPDQATLRGLARTVSRFSGFALGSVLLLAASGLVMGTLIVGSLDALPGTTYGRTLLLKLGIVAPALALAGWNRFVLLPRITGEPTRRSPWQTLTGTLRNEAALLVAVVAVTGLLTNTRPSHAEHNHPGSPSPTAIPLDVTSQGLEVTGTLSPGTVGVNHLTFALAYQSQPLTTDQVTVTARLPAQELGPLQAGLSLDRTTGRYSAELTLPAAGEWQLQISARIDTFTKPVALVDLTIV